jgi:hypothetical protein
MASSLFNTGDWSLDSGLRWFPKTLAFGNLETRCFFASDGPLGGPFPLNSPTLTLKPKSWNGPKSEVRKPRIMSRIARIFRFNG